MTIDSTLGESVMFANPMARSRSTPARATTSSRSRRSDAAFDAALTIHGDADGDTINLNAALSLGSATSSAIRAGCGID